MTAKEPGRLLMNQLTVEHTVPGRIRLKIPAIRSNTAARNHFEQGLQKMDGVWSVSGNISTGSLVIFYDRTAVGQNDIVNRGKKLFEIPGEDISGKHNPRPAARTSRSLIPSLGRFLELTMLVGAVFVWEMILKRPVSQGFFSPLGAMTSLAAWPLLRKGWKRLQARELTLESFLGGGVFLAVVMGQAKAALEILWINSAGELLQDWVSERSRVAIQEILELTEKETSLLADGVEVRVPVDQVQVGNTVVLSSGEKIAVDGEITQGEGFVDESSITGRAEPVFKQMADKVLAGTYVRNGVLYVQAQEVGDQTYLARVLHRVQESLENKSPIEGVADHLAQRLVKIGVAATCITLVATRDLWRTFSVMLVMSCPCATILAASTAISAALNAAARKQILIMGGRYLEAAGKANVFCWDKTGTLTTMEPELRKIYIRHGSSEDDLLQLAFSAELHSNHPLAKAIKHEAHNKELVPLQTETWEYFPGLGIRACLQGNVVLVGNVQLMNRFAVDARQLKAFLKDAVKQEQSLVLVANNQELLGGIGFGNRERADADQVLRYLRADGVEEMILITGDAKESAYELAERLHVSHCHFSIFPEEKAKIVKSLQERGDKVFMVGDGINDALALTQADIGVAMGASGSEVAIEAADIALVKDDLKGVVYVRCLSRKTIQVVHQNFWIATGSNLVGVILGALGLLSPVMAGMVHISHTLGILANSSRILIFHPPAFKQLENL